MHRVKLWKNKKIRKINGNSIKTLKKDFIWIAVNYALKVHNKKYRELHPGIFAFITLDYSFLNLKNNEISLKTVDLEFKLWYNIFS